MHRLLAAALLLIAVPALAGSALDDKNGFRDAKLGADFATFKDMKSAGKGDGLLFYTRKDDNMTLFKLDLSSIVYGFKEAVLDEIVITGAWSLKDGIKACEVDNDHVLANLIKAFGKATKTHSYSSTEGKRCLESYAGGIADPYCRVREWRGEKVRMSLFQVVTNAPEPAPKGADKPEDWRGYSCRFVIEYARITNPLDDL